MEWQINGEEKILSILLEWLQWPRQELGWSREPGTPYGSTTQTRGTQTIGLSYTTTTFPGALAGLDVEQPGLQWVGCPCMLPALQAVVQQAVVHHASFSFVKFWNDFRLCSNVLMVVVGVTFPFCHFERFTYSIELLFPLSLAVTAWRYRRQFQGPVERR